MKYWRTGIMAETKVDDSPVTRADREAEHAISKALSGAFPDDGQLGEEGSAHPSRSGRRWIIDPIDGTRDFIRGNRAWAVLIALEDAQEVVAGVVYMPATGDLFQAAKGGGAFCNGQPIRVSTVSRAEEAVLSVNGFNIVQQYPFASRLMDWMPRFWSVRSMGGCVDAMMIASGQADLWIEPAGKAWDFAPLQVIVEEAGGMFFNFDGGRSIYGGNCICCAPGLEAEARHLLASS
jgi:histidinol phosphatase-like enzyme (inositol monophosphatase family)